MSALLSIIVGLVILVIAFKVLTGFLKIVGVIGAIIIAAVIYFAMGGAGL